MMKTASFRRGPLRRLREQALKLSDLTIYHPELKALKLRE